MYHLIFVVKIKNIMNVSILGNGLTSLTLAKMLVNQGIKVDIFLGKKTKRYNKIQTLGISKTILFVSAFEPYLTLLISNENNSLL